MGMNECGWVGLSMNKIDDGQVGSGTAVPVEGMVLCMGDRYGVPTPDFAFKFDANCGYFRNTGYPPLPSSTSNIPLPPPISIYMLLHTHHTHPHTRYNSTRIYFTQVFIT
jgi:hypothetical protein